ncbi:MAG TPA: hypothetical protein PKX93_10520 [bacterium]|nr:hypothetical protein [bacterium]HOL67877.1 hypothetical protein [bacterium]
MRGRGKVVLAGMLVWTIAAAAVETTKPGGRTLRQRKWAEGMKQWESLNLTDAQKEQLKPLFQKMREQLQAVIQDSALTPAEKQEKIAALRKAHEAELEKILSPEQMEKWRQIRSSAGKEKVRQRLNEIISTLNLTEEQKEKIKPLLQREAEEWKNIFQDPTLTAEQKQEKIRALRQETRTALKEILTPEQWQKLQEIKRERPAAGKEKKRQQGLSL